MPVKWTPDYDQLLLLKILETHDISVDAKKISAAWPSGRGDVPTARAITERLVKIRQLARASGAGHFGISSSQAKSASGKTSGPRTPSKTSLLANKSTRVHHNSTLVDDDDEPIWIPKPDREQTLPIKKESLEQNGFEIVEHGPSQFRHPTICSTPGPSPALSRQKSVSLVPIEEESPTKRARLEGFDIANHVSSAGAEHVARWRSQAPSISTIHDDEDDAV